MRRMITSKQIEELIKQNSIQELKQSDITITPGRDLLNIKIPEPYVINSISLVNDMEESILVVYDPINKKYDTSDSDIEGIVASSTDLTNNLRLSAESDLSTFDTVLRITYLFGHVY